MKLIHTKVHKLFDAGYFAEVESQLKSDDEDQN